MKKDNAKAKDKQTEAEAAVEETAAAAEAAADAAADEASALLEKLAEQDERHLRLAAEYENFRKRSARERERAYGDATVDVVKTLVPLFESIDRCESLSETLDDKHSAFAEGVCLMAQQADQLLASLGVEAVGARGDAFDPNVHHAVSQIKAEAESGSIVEVIQKGYTLGERLIRPALVVVAE